MDDFELEATTKWVLENGVPPTDALPEEDRGRVLDILEEMAFTVPTEDGHYEDNEGDVWELRDGHWHPPTGEHFPDNWIPSLAVMAPWTKVES